MNTSTYNRTRWLTLFGTIVTQFALGSVYTWSLFNSALSDKLGAPVSQVAFSFGLLSLGLAISSSVAGKLQERFGVKRVTMASGILLGLGFFLTAHSSNLMMLWLSAGVLVGLADGAGYLLTLSNCVKWFPERKGLISAFAIGSYGLGSLGFKFIDAHLLASVGLFIAGRCPVQIPGFPQDLPSRYQNPYFIRIPFKEKGCLFAGPFFLPLQHQDPGFFHIGQGMINLQFLHTP